MRLAECFNDIFAFTIALLEMGGGADVPEVIGNDTSAAAPSRFQQSMPQNVAALIARHEGGEAPRDVAAAVAGDGVNLEKVRDTFCRLFTASSDMAVRNNFSDSDYRLAKFALCAWIDERIVTSTLTDRLQWHSMELQRLYFQTTNAGEEFFSCLASLRPTQSSVMEVYSLCLSMGFQGKYFGRYESEELNGIKRAVARGVLGRSPEMSDSHGIGIMSGAYPGEAISQGKISGDMAAKIMFILIPLVILTAMFVVYNRLLDNLMKSLF